MTDLASFPRLLGDVGGTNARFALQLGPETGLSQPRTYACADHPTLEDAMRLYLGESGAGGIADAALGIANPVTGDEIRMTNHHWHFSTEALRLALGFRRLRVINDFTALALALPALPASDIRQVGTGEAVPGCAIALIGPGTGLGVSGLCPARAGRAAMPLDGEGGHVTLAAADDEEAAVVAHLRQRFGHASAERALSGPGIENLDAAVRAVRGLPPLGLGAQEVTQHAEAGTDPVCVAVIALFFSLLGTVAGNLALTLGARGGVYIGGGIVPRLGTAIDRSAFRHRFEAKGRYQDYLGRIPTFVVQAPVSPALLGAARALDDF